MARIYGQEPDSINDEGEEVYTSTFNFFWHVYAVTVWLGQLLFAFFGGVGLINLPYDLIMEYFYRPKPITKENFEARRKFLLPMASKLRDEGKKLESDYHLVRAVKGIAGICKRYKFG